MPPLPLEGDFNIPLVGVVPVPEMVNVVGGGSGVEAAVGLNGFESNAIVLLRCGMGGAGAGSVGLECFLEVTGDTGGVAKGFAVANKAAAASCFVFVEGDTALGLKGNSSNESAEGSGAFTVAGGEGFASVVYLLAGIGGAGDLGLLSPAALTVDFAVSLVGDALELLEVGDSRETTSPILSVLCDDSTCTTLSLSFPLKLNL